MPDHSRPSSGIPERPRSLLELVDQLCDEFPDLSAHTVVRCVSIVAHHPSSTALNFDALLRHTERIARARLTHLAELPGQLVGRQPTSQDGYSSRLIAASTEA
jgi:hypothetical protein